MNRVYAIDPGPERSAVVVLNAETRSVAFSGEMSTDEMISFLKTYAVPDHTLAIEQIQNLGMIVGADVFETAYVSGRYAQAWADACGGPIVRYGRIAIKMAICHNTRAKDANIRQALIDRYGVGKQQVIGTKKSPGPLYGVTGHEWSALAVGITHLDVGVHG